MPKKYLTIEDLLLFCKQSNLHNFSAVEAGGPIILQSFGKAEIADTTKAGLTPCTLQACHTELNKNASFIDENTMNKALSSFANRPILGYIHQLEDGSWNFMDHRMELQEDGDDVRIEYLESPIGVIPESCNAHLAYDEEKDKTYVVVNGYLYDDYGNRAVDIIKNNGGEVAVSIEIAVNSMSYNAKENYLNIEDFTFLGVTCLGKTPDGTVVNPGMEGANLKLDNFSAKQNSMFSDKLIETLEKINYTLESFNKNTVEDKGGERDMDKFKELLEKYGKVEEDITFNIEELTDEELEAKFEEAFGEPSVEPTEEPVEPTEEPVEPAEEPVVEETTPDVSDEGGAAEPDALEVEMAQKKKRRCELKYELSHDDIRGALYNLIEPDEDGYCSAWIMEVFDDKFIYMDCAEGKYYRQKYSVDGDNVALEGEKVEIFNEWLTKEEKEALEALKSEYAELKSFKENYDIAELKAQKDEVLSKAEYECLAENEEFNKLVSEAENYSVEEIKVKADLIFAAHMKSTMEFNAKTEDKKVKTIGFNFNKKETKKSPYGNLFSEK